MPQSRFRFSRVVPLLATAAIIACGVFPSVASAQTLFTDDFEGDTGGLGKTSLTNWTVTNSASGGSVDIIGVGTGFDFYGGTHGHYIDLDGDTSAAGVLTTKSLFALTAGDYTLNFDLGKNGSALESMTVSVGSVFSQVISDENNYPAFVAKSFSFTVAFGTTGAITFNQAGTDKQGYIIDNVSLVRQRVATTAPEPGSLSLLAMLPVSFGLLRLRRRK